MPLTFSQLKNTILANVRTKEFCRGYHDAQISTTEVELIQSNLENKDIVWLYCGGIITDALLSEFTEANLNANNIYTTGTFTLNNPVDPVYIVKGANVTINVSGDNPTEVYHMGAGTVILNLSDNGFCELRTYLSSTINVISIDSGLLCYASSDDATATIVLNGNSNAFVNLSDKTDTTITGNDSTFANVRGTGKSNFNVTVSGSASYDYQGFDDATLNNAL